MDQVPTTPTNPIPTVVPNAPTKSNISYAKPKVVRKLF